MKTEKATFGMGCFWGVELLFSQIPGVIKTQAGYMGGLLENPGYEQVCRGDTGHAEAVQIEFDSEKVKYEELLNVFWKNHNPTEINRQGPDVGEQYRSVIFCHTPEQKELALKSRAEYAGKTKKKPATQIQEAMEFYPAEEYHQKYLEKRGLKSCHINY